jgi:hypothetical protein
MLDCESAERLGREWLNSGRKVEDILVMWRERGLSILRSIQALSHVTETSFGHAKATVHNSNAWSDMRGEYDRMHEELESVVE